MPEPHITPPTREALYEALCGDSDAIAHISTDHDTSWRHGSRERSVFHRHGDDTYWS